MPTSPFGPALEAALKEPTQGGKMTMNAGRTVIPRFFCCISGTSVGVAKDPVAVLIVNPTQQLVNRNVNSDYSRSWSPSSTLVSWSIDWGDGNISNGAWPGAGNVNHPLGGYTLPGIYTVRLTVTDLLGATGEDSQQVEIVTPDFAGYAGCGSSGVWFTEDGRSWITRGGGVLENVPVYDLKANYFTLIPGEPGYIELWAATENGLYRSPDGGLTWIQIDFGQVAGETRSVMPYSIIVSPVLNGEVYVLALGANAIYLLRTEDRGLTWANVVIGEVNVKEDDGDAGMWEYGHKFYSYQHGTYSRGAVDTGGTGIRLRNANTQAWVDFDCEPINRTYAIYQASALVWGGPGNPINGYWLWNVGDGRPGNPAGRAIASEFLACQNCVATNNKFITDITTGGAWGGGDMVAARADVIPNQVESYDTQGAVLIGARAIPLGMGRINHLLSADIIACRDGPRGRILEWQAGPANYQLVWSDPNIIVYGGFGDFGGLHPDGATYFAAMNRTRLLIRNAAGNWVWDDNECPIAIKHAMRNASGGDFMVCVGDEGAYIYDFSNARFIPLPGAPPNCERVWVDSGGIWVMTSGADAGIFRLGGTAIPEEGRFHLTDMSRDGQYAYVALALVGMPVVYRVRWDLGEVDTIFSPGDGSWGGVKVDENFGNVLWVFGDFGNADKIEVSDDHGDTFTNVTDAGWGANEVVRPVMPTIYDPTSVVAILNVAREAHESGDLGQTWGLQGSTNFDVDCAIRDWIDDQKIVVGRSDEEEPPPSPPAHLQVTPNKGNAWEERSTGISPSNARITALQITG